MFKGYDVFGDGDWYLCLCEFKCFIVVELYCYEIGGKLVLMIMLFMLVLDNGIFFGVVIVDFGLVVL